MRLIRSFVVCALAVGLACGPASIASATHDVGRFELDANASDGGAAGPDWSKVVPTDRVTGEVARTMVADGAAPPQDSSYFTGGGSKDTNDVTEWEHTSGDVAPDKNEITNAYAVAFRSERDTGKTDRGDLLFYFGADRYANNGDAQMGFWFFREPVGIGSGGSFTGEHTRGDILVLAHFTQGGRVGTAEVYRWVGSGGSDGSLDLVATGATCASSLEDDAVCSVANRSGTDAPWSYTPKSGAAGTFPQGSFFEGGINVSRLAPGVECWSSYLAETRSSQSVDAQLKDLALGDFDTCPPPRQRTRAAASTPRKTTPRVSTADAAPAQPVLAASGPEDLPGITLVGAVLMLAGALLRRTADGARLSAHAVTILGATLAPVLHVPADLGGRAYRREQDRLRRRRR